MTKTLVENIIQNMQNGDNKKALDKCIAGYVTLAMSQLHKKQHEKLGTMTSHGYILEYC